MKATADKKHLVNALKVVKRGISGRATQPVQNSILLEADGDKLTLTATDLEYVSVQKSVPANVETSGIATINGMMAAELFGSLPDGDVTISHEDKAVYVATKHTKFKLPSLNVDDFQKLPVDDAQVVEVDAKLLRAIIKKTAFCVARDETRPVITGVLFIITKASIKAVATDTYRLAILEVPLAQNFLDDDFRAEVIISRRLLGVLQSDLPSEGTVRMSFGDNTVAFSFDDTVIASRLIEGKFVNYARVIPGDHKRSLVCKTQDLMDTVQRVLVVAKDDNNRIVLYVDGDELSVKSDVSDIGKAEDTLKCHTTGEFTNFSIGFNGAYLLQMLGTTDSDEVKLELNEDVNPVVMKDGSASYQYVLMPVQVVGNN